MRNYKRKGVKKTYSDEVHSLAMKHLGLIFSVASRRGKCRGHRYRDIDDLVQEAYIGILSAAAEVIAGEMPESEFAKVAAGRAHSRVNMAANRTYAAVSVPWYVVARNWQDKRAGLGCSLPKEGEAILEEIAEGESSEWSESLMEEALRRLDPADAALLRRAYGIGCVQRTTKDAMAETGLSRESICKPVREARARLRPILEELMRTEYGRM